MHLIKHSKAAFTVISQTPAHHEKKSPPALHIIGFTALGVTSDLVLLQTFQ